MGFVEEARSEADQTNDLSLRSSIAGYESRMLRVDTGLASFFSDSHNFRYLLIAFRTKETSKH